MKIKIDPPLSDTHSYPKGTVHFWCPGCDCVHGIQIGEGPGPRWTYNDNPNAPTFRNSVLVSWGIPSDDYEKFDDPKHDKKHICHSYITDGKIQFLNDCTHPLVGQTVALPDVSEWKK